MVVDQSSFSKKLVYSASIVLIFFVLVEVSIRVLYFQMVSGTSMATIHALKYAQKKYKTHVIKKKVSEARKILEQFPNIADDLFTEEGREVLSQLENEYEKHFFELLRETNRIKSKFMVVYTPLGEIWNDKRGAHCRKFLNHLSNKYRVVFLDLTNELTKHPQNFVTLIPADGHFSRYGNQIIAVALDKFLKKYDGYHSNIQHDGNHRILGDLPPNTCKIWEQKESMPYRVVCNQNGLRMNRPVSQKKRKQRILVLGDSVTFGPYLPNHDTFPSLLEQINQEREVLNAGMIGYTVSDVASLFIERAKYCAPDITILQVSKNDISDFFYFFRNWSAREGRGKYRPQKAEEEFILKLKKRSRISGSDKY